MRKVKRPRRQKRPVQTETSQERVRRKHRKRPSENQRPKKITKMPRSGILNLNIGAVIFGALAIYIVLIVISYLRSTHISGYEVKLGSLAMDTTARAVAIRDEHVSKVREPGYINYYAREGERAAVGDLVYTVDETGQLSDQITESQTVSSNLKESDLATLKTDIQNYKVSYTPKSFKSIYDFKFDLEGTAEQISNESIMAILNSVSGNGMSSAVDMGYASQSGIVAYETDGLENLDVNSITADIFDEDAHKAVKLSNGSLVSVSDNAYRVTTTENWSIVLQWNETWDDKIVDDDYIKVCFLKDGNVIWGLTKILNNSDGKYLQLSFTNSMMTYASERYLDVELMTNDQTGLKIPNSSIIKKEFYLVPEDYLTQGGDTDNEGFMRKTFLENGTESTEFVATEVYDKQDGYCYVDTDSFHAGDVLVKPDSEETFTLNKKDTLTGVYNLNSGYADFRKIKVLEENKEYSIVESGTQYGLNVYDHIVLDGENISDKDFMFQ